MTRTRLSSATFACLSLFALSGPAAAADFNAPGLSAHAALTPGGAEAQVTAPGLDVGASVSFVNGPRHGKPTTDTPEPATLAVLGMGLGVWVLVRRRRQP